LILGLWLACAGIEAEATDVEEVRVTDGRDPVAWRELLTSQSPEDIARAIEKEHVESMMQVQWDTPPTLVSDGSTLVFTMVYGEPPEFVPTTYRVTVDSAVTIDRFVPTTALESDPVADLQSEDRAQRKAAAQALGESGEASAVFALNTACGKETHTATANAMVDAIAAIGGPEGQAALKALAEAHPDERVRNRAQSLVE